MTKLADTEFSAGDVFDIRDVIARFEQLETDAEGVTEDEDQPQYDREIAEEMSKLRALLEETRGNGGDEQWRGGWYPLTFIAESYFKEYAQELAEDCGMIKRDASWPNNHIDWKAAADELKIDYSTVEFDGTTYYYR